MNHFINESLFAAVESGNTAKVKELLTEEGKVIASSFFGYKSIVCAAEKGYNEILKMLLESNAKSDRKSFWSNSYHTGSSALRYASRHGNVEAVKLLLEYGAGVDKNNLNNALIEAYLSENMQLIDLLRSAGADEPVNFDNAETMKLSQNKDFFKDKGYFDDELLIKSAKNGDIKTVKALLDEKVNEKALLAAVDAALEKNHWKVAMILSECSDFTNIDIYTECLKRMFLKASYTGDTEKVKFFLERLIENVVGVLTDETGKSTLEIALENNPEDIIKILSNYGFHENSLKHAYKCLIDN